MSAFGCKADKGGVRPTRSLRCSPFKNAANAIGYDESAILCCKSHATGGGGPILERSGGATFGGCHDQVESTTHVGCSQGQLGQWVPYDLVFGIGKSQRPDIERHWRPAKHPTPGTTRHVLDPRYFLMACCIAP